MTEAKALVLTLVAGLAVFVGAFVLLASMDVGTDVLLLVYIATLGASAYAASSIVMHYGSKRRRR
jgi:preprotein translocase subunit SecY